MPGAPLLRRTPAHARRRTSLRRILSYSAWNRRPGSALAARYSACCKARTGSPATGDPFAAGLALTALTGPLQTTLRTDEAAALPSPQVVLSRRSNRYYGRLRRHPASPLLPGPAGYRTPRSGDNTAGHRAGEGLPRSRRHPRYVPRPLRRGVPHGCASRLYTASMAFTLITRARHSLAPPSTGGNGYDAAGFASCYGPHRRSPIQGS